MIIVFLKFTSSQTLIEEGMAMPPPHSRIIALVEKEK